MEKKIAIVTGGAGFIGAHLCRALLARGYRVISLDNYFTGTKEAHVEGVEYREGHAKDIAQHVTETPDVIYHLGEYARVAQSLQEPQLVWDLNIAGTLGVVEFWREKRCKLVYAGSSTKAVGAREDGVQGRDLSPYTWAKAAMSDLVDNYGRWYELPYAIMYFYNVYGPGERALGKYGTFIETLRQRFLAGETLTVRSPGTQRRVFTHVEDTVDAIITIGERGEGDGYGIASEDDYSLLEVAQMFGGEIEMLPQTSTTREKSEISCEKTHALGWRAMHSLKDYIEDIKLHHASA